MVEVLKLPRRFSDKIIKDLDFIQSYGCDSIESIYLFGSCARGDIKATSDVDLLVVYNGSISREIKGDMRMVVDEPLLGVRTDLVFVNKDCLYTDNSMFMRTVRENMEVLWKRE